MQSDIRREIVLAMRHAVRASIAFCFAASSEDEEQLDGVQWLDGEFTVLPSQSLQTLIDAFQFPAALAVSESSYCVPVATLSGPGAASPTASLTGPAALLDVPNPLLPSGKNALLLYLCLGDSLYGMAGLARCEDEVAFDESEIQQLEQIGPVLSSLTMLHAHVLRLQRRPTPMQPVMLTLSEREQQVARLLADGYSCVNTAAVLNLSENTVRTYVRRLYRKLEVTNRVDLVQRLIAALPTSVTP